MRRIMLHSDLKRTLDAHDIELAKVAWLVGDHLTSQYGLNIVEAFFALVGCTCKELQMPSSSDPLRWIRYMEIVDDFVCHLDNKEECFKVLEYLLPPIATCELVYQKAKAQCKNYRSQ